MATMTGTWSGYSFIRTRIECYEISGNASANTSVMRADVYVDTSQSLSASNTTFVANIAGNERSWARGYTTFGVGSTYIGTHDVTVGHDINGAGSASFSARHSGTFGGSSNTGTGYAGMTDFNRAPTAPGSVTANATGPTVVVTSSEASTPGPTITGYFVSYRSSTNGGSTWSAWSAEVSMTSRAYTYTLTPGQTYQFRVRAQNSDGFSPYTESATLFLTAGGKRWTGDNWALTVAQAKRFNGTSWIDLTTAKRFDGATWVNLS
jgi:hypothetical protein